eukprot:COSAG05_NODE_22853_length_262_cov_0.533742_1_plen_56_part_10
MRLRSRMHTVATHTNDTENTQIATSADTLVLPPVLSGSVPERDVEDRYLPADRPTP